MARYVFTKARRAALKKVQRAARSRRHARHRHRR